MAFNRDLLQPGLQRANLLTIFRYTIIVRSVVSLLLWLAISSRMDYQSFGRSLAILDGLLLTVYLYATRLQRAFKERYIPIALMWATMGPLLTSTFTMYLFFTAPMPDPLGGQLGLIENFVLAYNIGVTVPVLLIPLLVVSWLYSRRTILLYLGGITLLDMGTLLLFVPLDGSVFVAFVLVMFRLVSLGFVGLIVNYLVTIQRQQASALRDYATTREHLIASQERNRLARELHDTLAHSLAAVTVQLEAVKVIWDEQPDRARQLVHDSADTVRDGLQEARRALQALRATTLESLGFVESIHALAKTMQQRHGVSVTVHATDDLAWLTNGQEHVLYRILQEALQNGATHAGAQHLRIDIETSGKRLHLAVGDDGSGFDPAHIDTRGHFGVQGMRERAQLIGAELEINSQVGQGTTIKVTLERHAHVHPHL